MAGQCIYPKLTCSRCSRENAVQRYKNPDESITGYCHKCQTRFNQNEVADLDGSDVEKVYTTPESTREELEEIFSEYPSLDLPDRGLKKKALERFNIRIGVSEQDGRTIKEHYYPYRQGAEIEACKVKIVESKDFFCKGSISACDPFGWREAMEIGGYTLHIVEGELDAVALYTAYHRERKQEVAVISLRNGADSAVKSIQPKLEEIRNKWKKVVLCLDQDEAGEKAAQALVQLFPEDFKPSVVNITEKDANDMLLAGKTKELVEACFNAKTPLAQGILQTDKDMFEQIKEMPEMGLSFPWPTLTKLTRGMRRGEVIYWGGPPKGGKSTMLNEIASWVMLEHQLPVFVIKPEESPINTLRRMSGAVVGRIFHDPDVPIDPSDVDRAQSLIGDKLAIYDKWQTPKWSDVRQVIRETVLSLGVKDVFIDPITNFSTRMSSSERNDFLIQMTREIAEDAQNYNFTAHIFCHFNKAPKGDKQWNDGRIPTSDDFQGSSAMAQAAHLMIGMQVWKKTDKNEENEFLNRCRNLHILEDRAFGVSDSVELMWQPSIGKLRERESND